MWSIFIICTAVMCRVIVPIDSKFETKERCEAVASAVTVLDPGQQAICRKD